MSGLRRAIAALSLLVAVLVASAGRAETVVVGSFTGAKSKLVRERVVKALDRGGFETASAEKVGSARKDDAKPFAEAATEHHAAGVVVGNVALKKAGWTLTLAVRGADGAILDEPQMKGAVLPALLRRIDEQAPEIVKSALAKSAATASPSRAAASPVGGSEKAAGAPAATPAKSEMDAEESGRTAPAGAERKLVATGPTGSGDPARDQGADGRDGDASRRPSPFEIVAGMQAFSRDLSYKQDVNQNLRPYTLPLGPAAFAELAWYPGAHFTRGAGAHVGLVGEYSRSIATSSNLDDGSGKYTTTLQAFSVGARGRIPLGEHEMGVSFRGGRHDFSVSGDPDAAATVASGAPVQRDLVPDVKYTYLRPGLDVRLQFGDVGFGARGGYRLVLAAGDVQSDAWFPRSTVVAGDAGLFATYALGSGLHAKAGADVRRYAFSMHSKPGDVKTNDVAGGAVDQYAAAYLAIEWRAR